MCSAKLAFPLAAALIFLISPAVSGQSGPSLRFLETLMNEAEPVYQATLQHPFLTGLADGSLPRDRFQEYLVQDAFYLRGFAQALSVLAAKAPREEWAAALNQDAVGALEEERRFHSTVLKRYGVTTLDGRSSNPSNHGYVSHLMAAVYQGSFAEGLAAVLPCYWIYLRVGRDLAKRGSKNADYAQWIRNYSSEGYEKTVRRALLMLAESEMTRLEQQTARRNFDLSVRYEYLFWDAAYRLERWPPNR